LLVICCLTVYGTMLQNYDLSLYLHFFSWFLYGPCGPKTLRYYSKCLLCVCFTDESKSYSFGRAVELLKKIMGSAKTGPRVLWSQEPLILLGPLFTQFFPFDCIIKENVYFLSQLQHCTLFFVSCTMGTGVWDSKVHLIGLLCTLRYFWANAKTIHLWTTGLSWCPAPLH